MFILCFNVLICFKMGSFYSYCDMITKLVYPLELQDSVLILLKFFGGGPQTPPPPPFDHNCYAPGSNDRGHIVFVLSVCLSVCLLSTLTFAITFEP